MGLTLSQNVIVLVHTLTVIPLTRGIPRFTQEPPGVFYVSSGGTARLVWDYYVRNRTLDFDPFSPDWAFYNTSGTKIRIGHDNGLRNWTFAISRECPSRMRNRISKESTATLVISNMTIADSGIYECILVLSAGSPKISKTRIVVTEPPHFNISLSPRTAITEGSSLSLQCSATGNPLPIVTWVRIQDDVMINEGHGDAVLRIVNITRQQNGPYECRAANNPNEDPVTIRTEISVIFSSEPTNVSVSEIQGIQPYTVQPLFNPKPPKTKNITEGQDMSLPCTAVGPPTPNVTWVQIAGHVIKSTGIGNATLKISNIRRDQHGAYECQAWNNPHEKPVSVYSNLEANEHSKYSAATTVWAITAILVLSLGLNVLLCVWLIRRLKQDRTKGAQCTCYQRKQNKKDLKAEIYDNELEMDDKATSTVTASFSQRQPTQTGPEYETIQQVRENATPFDGRCSNDPIQYQRLNLSPKTFVQQNQGPVYEPLRTRSVESLPLRNDNVQHSYEPINIRNQATDYQSLQSNSR